MNGQTVTDKRYPWKRRWIERGIIPLDSSAARSAVGRVASEDAYLDIQDFINELPGERPCIVMLGEPGIGKTNTIQELIEAVEPAISAAGHQIMFVDLHSIGSEERLERKIFQAPRFVQWKNGEHHLTLFLDSLDECLLRVDTAANILLDELKWYPLDRLSLRIACRTADWPLTFEEGLRKLWRREPDEDRVYVYELSPLQEEDIKIAASIESIDPDSFLEEVERVSAMPFAIKPLTLSFLLKIFGADHALPDTRREIYRRGCQLLCEEPDPDRNRRLSTTAKTRLEIAKRIAYVTVFGNKYAIWIDPDYGDLPPEDVKLSDLIDGTITPQAIRETLNTGLFRSRGSRSHGLSRLGWAHLSYAEFLAAEYVIDNNLSKPQILSISTSRDGAIVPQLKEVFSWLAEAYPALQYDLIARDPACFLESHNLSIPNGRQADVTRRLLELLDEQKLLDDNWAFRQSYARLLHPGLSAQLRPIVVDKTKNFIVRRVAIDITEACGLGDLQEDLLQVALDSEEDIRTRANAAYALWRIGDSATRAKMKPLALDSSLEDPYDELKGAALLCVWPEHLTTNELFNILRAPKAAFIGSYHLFLNEFTKDLQQSDLPVALDWCREYVQMHSYGTEDPFTGMQSVVDGVMQVAWDHLGNPDVLEGFSEVALIRLRNFQEIIHSRASSLTNSGSEGFRERIQTDTSKRHKLVEVLIEKLISNGNNIYLLMHPGYLVSEEDTLWLIEKARLALSSEVKRAYQSLAARVFNWQNADHIQLVYEACQSDVELQELFRPVFGPIELSSSEAEKTRRDFSFWKEQEAKRLSQDTEAKPIDPPPIERVRTLLNECEAGDTKKWWLLAYWMARDSHDHSPDSDDLDYDITHLTQWSSLSEAEHSRVVNAAKAYLTEQKPEPTDWLQQQGRYFLPVIAGYKALWLLLAQDQESFMDLPHEIWEKWIPVIVIYGDIASGFSIGNRGEWRNTHKKLVNIAYRIAPDIVIETLLHFIDSRKDSEVPTYLFWEFADCWDEAFGNALLSKMQDPQLSSACYQELLDELLKHDSSEAWGLAFVLLKPPFADLQERRRAENAAYAMIQYDAERCWPTIWSTILEDEEFAHSIITRLAGSYRDSSFTLGESLSLDQLKSLFTWLETHYPRAEDPDTLSLGFHKISDREEIGDFRSGIFQQIALQATPEAVSTVESLIHRFPDEEWMTWSLVRARELVRKASWKPFEVHELLELVASRETRLIQTGTELLELVMESLERFQDKLQRHETPMAGFLWHKLNDSSCRPRSENDLSDYIKDFLEGDLVGKGIVINREVQIRRRTGSKSGQETDIYVAAVRDTGSDSAYDVVTVVIEVKGCWNDDLNTAMEKQLRDRYLLDNGFSHGVYVVGWFSSASWRQERRKQICERCSFSDLQSRFSQQAEELSDENLDIRAFVLDISF